MGGGAGSSGGGAAGSGSSSWGDLDELNNGNASQHSAGSNSSPGGGGGGGAGGGKSKRSISTKVRMLVKDTRPATQTSSNSDGMDQKPLRQTGHQDKYEEVVLIAAPVKGEFNTNTAYSAELSS